MYTYVYTYIYTICPARTLFFKKKICLHHLEWHKEHEANHFSFLFFKKNSFLPEKIRTSLEKKNTCMSGSGIHGVRQAWTSPVTSGTAGKTTFVMMVKVICSMIESEYMSIVRLFAYVYVWHTATHCNTLQHTATHCNTRLYVSLHLCTSLLISVKTTSVMIVRWCAVSNRVSHHRKEVGLFCNSLFIFHVSFNMFVVPERPLRRTNPLKSLGRARQKCSPGMFWRQIRRGCHTQRVLPNPCWQTARETLRSRLMTPAVAGCSEHELVTAIYNIMQHRTERETVVVSLRERGRQ